MSYFHDKEYEGVVLKIKTLFRDKEKGIESLKKIKDIIKNEIEPNTFISTYHPDWRKTYNELDDWDDKMKMLAEEEQAQKEKERKRREREKDIQRHNIIKLDYKTINEAFFIDDSITLGGKEFERNDILNRRSIKKSFTDYINNLLYEDRLEFLNSNYSFIHFTINTTFTYTEDLLTIPNNFIYYTERKISECEVAYKFNRLNLLIYLSETDYSIRYSPAPLYYDHKKELYFIYENDVHDLNDIPKQFKQSDVPEYVKNDKTLNTDNKFIYYLENYTMDLHRKEMIYQGN